MATQTEIAAHLDLSDRRIRDLIKEGVLPASKGKGGLDLTACRLAYIRHLRGIASGQVQSTEDLELNRERAILAREQSRKIARENDIADGKVAPIQVITDTIARAGAVVMANLESLPAMMKRSNPQLTAHDINIVRKVIAKCCRATSQMQRLDDEPAEVQP